MIIDCHGHYTTAPAEAEAWRKLQVQALSNPSQAPAKASLRPEGSEWIAITYSSAV